MKTPHLPRNFTLCWVCTLITVALAVSMAAARLVGPA